MLNADGILNTMFESAVDFMPESAAVISFWPIGVSAPTCAAAALSCSGDSSMPLFPWVAFRPVTELPLFSSGFTKEVLSASLKSFPVFCLMASLKLVPLIRVPSAFISLMTL